MKELTENTTPTMTSTSAGTSSENAALAGLATLAPGERLMTLDAFKAGRSNSIDKAYVACKAYAEYLIDAYKTNGNLSGCRGLILIGTCGTGKTHLARSVWRALAEAGISSEFRDMGDVFNDVAEGWASDLNRTKYFGKVRLLAVDDLRFFKGYKDPESWKAEALFDIFNQRSNNRLPSIITTNLYDEDLTALLGSRVYSRLRGASKVHYLEGSDYRIDSVTGGRTDG